MSRTGDAAFPLVAALRHCTESKMVLPSFSLSLSSMDSSLPLLPLSLFHESLSLVLLTYSFLLVCPFASSHSSSLRVLPLFSNNHSSMLHSVLSLTLLPKSIFHYFFFSLYSRYPLCPISSPPFFFLAILSFICPFPFSCFPPSFCCPFFAVSCFILIPFLLWPLIPSFCIVYCHSILSLHPSSLPGNTVSLAQVD